MFLVLRSSIFSLVLLPLLCLKVAAATPLNYFSAEVPIVSQSRSDQEKAARVGLMDVLVRVSGSEDVREHPLVAQRTRQPLSFVSEFQYADIEDAAQAEQGFNHLLKLRYSNRLVRKLLADAALPVWSVNRPKTLVWLVEDNVEFGKQMMPYDTDSPMFLGLEEASRYRGVPLSFPLLDFDDQISLGAERLWALDEQAIIEASARYKADVILVGKFSVMSSGQVFSSWQYIHGDKTRVYNLRADTPEQVSYNALLPVADFLASRYSYHSLDSEYFSLVVESIESYADYRAVVNTLKSFDTITDVKIDAVSHAEIMMRFRSEASLDQVTKQIALARKFTDVFSAKFANTPEWERPELGSPENPLRYQWR